MALSRLEYLFECYVSHQCSTEEVKEFMTLLVQSDNEPAVKKLIEKVIENTGSEMKMPDEMAVSILQKILQKKDNVVKVSINYKKATLKTWLRAPVAAAIVLFISGVSYWAF